MSDKPEQTATASEKSEKADVTSEASEPTTETTTQVDNQVDYKAELERERERADNAEKALAKRAYDDRKARRESVGLDESTDDLDPANQPLTRGEFQDMLNAQEQKTQKLVQSEKIAAKIRSIANSASEAELIQAVYENRRFPSDMTLDEQIEEAYVIANKKRLLGERDEAMRAAKSKGSTTVSSEASGHPDPLVTTSEPAVPADIKQQLSEQGIKWSVSSKRYEKKMPDGSLLVYDAKSKQLTPVK